jgi:hypothetical protein
MAKVTRRMSSGAGHGDLPPTPFDKKMSIKHAKDSVKFNMRHAKDHLKAAKLAKKRLAQVRRARIKAG